MESPSSHNVDFPNDLATTGKRPRHRPALLLLLLVLLIGVSLATFFWPMDESAFTDRSGRDDALMPSSVDTSSFDGDYELVMDESLAQLRDMARREMDPARRAQSMTLIRNELEQFQDFHLRRGVIRSGRELVQEFSLQTAKVDGTTLLGKALWHEDVHDPGDASEETILLRLDGDMLEFSMLDEQGAPSDVVVLMRVGRH